MALLTFSAEWGLPLEIVNLKF